MAGLSKTSITSLPKVYSGKVRDSYLVGDDKLLIVATDRISAFDVILGDPIPGKGKVLTSITDFWFKKLEGVLPNHLTDIDPTTVVAPDEVEQVRGRAVVAMRLKPILVECVARGYIIGGGWKDYQATGKVCGIELPPGLRMGENFPNRSSLQLLRLRLVHTTKIFRLNVSLNSMAKKSPQRLKTPRWNSIVVPANTLRRVASLLPIRSLNSVLTLMVKSA